MNGSAKYTYSDVRRSPSEAPEVLEFDLFFEGRIISVTVSREAVEDHAAKVGIEIENLADGYVGFLKTYQPEFASAAFKKHRKLETVALTSADSIEA